MRARRGCLLLLVAAAVPVPAHAATEQVIGSRGAAADVAVDDAGGAFAVSPTTLGHGGTLPWVRSRAAAPGARFGPARTLMRSRRRDRVVDAGIAGDGGGVIVVQSRRRRQRSVQVAAFAARGPARRPVTLSRGRGSADFAASAVARGGAAVVVWFRHSAGRRWRLEAAIREPRADAFGPPRPLSAFVRRACCTSVSVAIGERGDVAAVWSSTSRPGAWAALRAPGRGFRRPQRVADDPSGIPRVVVGAGGTAALLYGHQHVPRRPGDGLQLRRAPSGAPFGAPEPVDASCRASRPDAAVTPSGRVLVACVADAGGDGSAGVRVFEAVPGEPPAATAALAADVASDGLAVAADDQGRAVVAWAQRVSAARRGLERAVAATRRARGSPFGAAVALGRPWTAAEPLLARLVPGGGALVAWKGARFGAGRGRRVALAVTRLP
jgi:hypothetical protein